MNDEAIAELAGIKRELKRIADILESYQKGSNDYPFPVEIGEPKIKVKGEIRTINAGKDF